jgi:tRNA-specific 2-thiouridylase
MSGGVDSSVAAFLLKAQGYSVSGVTMRFPAPEPGDRPGANDAIIKDAQAVAARLGIPHHVLDLTPLIDEKIVEHFVQEYLHGRTPNPCVRCNRLVKFGAMYEQVKGMGADYLATGHYARLIYEAADQRFHLMKARDPDKDQSYFLYGLPRQQLSSILFPLGDLSKQEVRKIARAQHLGVAHQKESQDICFVPASGYKQFIRDRVGPKGFTPGDFIDEKGRVVGQHQGIVNYTIGQRDKLGIALGERVYVNRIDVDNNAVHVGPRACLYAQGLYARHVNLLAEKPKETVELKVRIRYNAEDVKAFVTWRGDQEARVMFQEPQRSVTPGQSVVFYQGEEVVGGGIIKEAITEA